MPFPESLMSDIEASKQDKARLTQSWSLSTSFLWGYQTASNSTSVVNPAQARQRRTRELLYSPNLLLDYYRVGASRLVVREPTATVMPTTASYEDYVRAVSTQEVASWLWWHFNMAGLWGKTMPYLLTTGNVGWRVYWDTLKKSVELDLIHPTDLFYEPGVRTSDDSSWVAVRYWVRKEQLKEQFPDHATSIDAASADKPIDTSWLTKLTSWLPTTKELKNRLEVYYVYDTDSRDMRIMLAGADNTSDILWEGKRPTGVLGIHHIKYTPMPDSPWGLSLIEPLIGPMAAYNLGRKQQLDHIDLVNKPKVLVPDDAKLRSGAFNNRAGEKIFYRKGYRPQYMVGPSWPAGAERNLDRIRGEMNDLAGMQNTSLGKQEGSASSGVAIRSLAAQDISKLQVTMHHISDVFQSVWRDALILYKEHLTEEQTVKRFDSYGAPIFINLNSTSLVDDPDVHIEADSLFPLMAREKDAHILDLQQAGVLSPEEAKEAISLRTDRGQALKHMRDLTRAQEILDVVKRGVLGADPDTGETLIMEVQIYKFDPLDAFVEVFHDFMSTPDFYKLPPDRQDVITDIWLACSNPNASGEPNSLISQIVYPPQAHTPAQLGGIVAGAESPMTSMGAIGQAKELEERKKVASLVKKVGTASKGAPLVGAGPGAGPKGFNSDMPAPLPITNPMAEITGGRG